MEAFFTYLLSFTFFVFCEQISFDQQYDATLVTRQWFDLLVVVMTFSS